MKYYKLVLLSIVMIPITVIINLSYAEKVEATKTDDTTVANVEDVVITYADDMQVTDPSEFEKLNQMAIALKAEFHNGPFGKGDGWKLAKKKKGVTVYTRDVDCTPMGQFWGEVEVKADFQRLVMFLNDDAHYPEWMYLMNVCNVVKKLNETETFVYTENQPIWPCKIRDTYTFKWWEQDPESGVVKGRFIGTPDFGPQKKGYVRVTLLMGQYTLTPKENGLIHITYEALTDPDLSSFVPTWAVKYTLKWTSYLTLLKIKKMLPLTRYTGQTLSWLKKPENIRKVDQEATNKTAQTATKYPAGE